MRNNYCGGGCAGLREVMRRGARESVAFARRRRGGLGWLHLGVENLDEFGRSEDVRWGMWKCESVKIWKYENMKMPSSAVVYAARGKLDDPVFKVSFHVQSFPYFHSFILAYFHTFTISPSASHGEFVSSSSSSHLRVPILNGIRRSRRQAFANTTNAVDIDIPMSLQNCPNSLLRSSSMRILNATCAIVISPVCKNSCIVSYSAANCNRATCSLEF